MRFPGTEAIACVAYRGSLRVVHYFSPFSDVVVKDCSWTLEDHMSFNTFSNVLIDF